MARMCEFRFYAELNDFLEPVRRYHRFTHEFDGTPAVKDRVESLGVPHTEVDLILVDGDSVPFSHRLIGGEDVSVYPVFERFDVSPLTRLRPRPLREPRFVADVNLGRLARYLRLLGFDCLYRNDFRDDELVGISLAEHRTVLTRDLGVLKRANLTHGAFVYETDPRKQLREVVDRFDLAAQVSLFTRCARCNGSLQPVQRADIEGMVPTSVFDRMTEFTRCQSCAQLYWPGGHADRLSRRLAAVGVSTSPSPR